MRQTAREFWRDEAGMGTVEIICKGLHAKYVFSEKPEKRCIYGKNRFCMLKNGKHAKYAK